MVMDRAKSARISKTVCKLCRQRKVRCDRKVPRCGSCARGGGACEYVEEKAKPGLRAGYVASLEERLKKLEDEVEVLKANQCGVSHAIQIATDHDSPPVSSNATSESTAGSYSTNEARSPPSFDPLSLSVLDDLCAAWFNVYHPWFPILHQPTLLEALHASPTLSKTPYHLVIQAIVVVTILRDHGCSSLSEKQRAGIADSLRNKIITEAIGRLSLQSLQAVLILSVKELGAGMLANFWNLVALAKRMGTQLGLRDLVAHHCGNFNRVSTIPPRMLSHPNSLVDREEKIRAYWMTEVLDGASSIGAAWNLSVSKPENTGLLPCSEAAWLFPEAVISAWPFDDSELSSAYSLYVILITNELFSVHRYFQQSFDIASVDDRLRRRNQCQTVDEALVAWRDRFAIAEVELRSGASGGYDPNVVLVYCTLDMATISLYQGLLMSSSEIGPDVAWNYATQRCLQACNSIANCLRLVQDTELENASPLLIPCIFVAARYLLAHAKLFNVDIPPECDALALSLKVCGSRWPYGQRLEKVVRTATAEQKLSLRMPILPIQFYDLQYSYLDIDEALRVWAEQPEPWSYLSALMVQPSHQDAFAQVPTNGTVDVTNSVDEMVPFGDNEFLTHVL